MEFSFSQMLVSSSSSLPGLNRDLHQFIHCMFLYCSQPCIIYIQHTSIWSAFHKAPSEDSQVEEVAQGVADAGNHTFENFVILGHSATVMTLPTFWPLSTCPSVTLTIFILVLKSVGWPHSACTCVLSCSCLSEPQFFFPMDMKMLTSSSLDYGKDFMTHCLLLAHTAAHTEPQIYMESHYKIIYWHLLQWQKSMAPWVDGPGS